MDQLYESYYSSLTFNMIIASVLLIMVILGIVFCKKIWRSSCKPVEKQLYVFVLLIFVGMLSFFSYKIILYVTKVHIYKEKNFKQKCTEHSFSFY